MVFKTASAAAALAVAALLGAGAACAEVQPQPAPPTPPIAPPVDTPYPGGVIRLNVDATDLAHAIMTMHEIVPVTGPGPMVLQLPKWLPGAHSPGGSIDKLAGLIITANGKRIEWVRDPVDVFSFHVDVPAGVSALDLDFQFLSPVSTREGRVVMTPEMLNVEWDNVALYPAGYFSRDVQIQPTVKLPDGWTPATALETDSVAGPVFTYKTTTFNTLVDSPLIAGKYFEKFDLDPGGPARVTLDVIADRPSELVAKPEQIAAHKALVLQAYKVFGSHHYDHYDFLFSLSDRMGGNGLEHHQSSEDGTRPTYFTEWDKGPAGRDLLAHEYTHSWNGKFRRPADLWTPSFNVPMRDSLLWVYEGQTQYWGYVLAARSGLLTKQEALDAIALTAAQYDTRVGRSWRALEDTTNDPIIAQRRPLSWLSWQRSEDYYSEGQLIWLDADTLIREKTGGKKSLDDFAAAFFGVDNGSFVTHPYTFEDIVAALNAVVPNDWKSFLRQRLDGHGPGAPLDGVARGGYKLVYTDTPTAYFKSAEMTRKTTNLMYGIGFALNKDGGITEVQWDGPAFKAGLTADMTIVAINGQAYDADFLKEVIKAAKGGTAPIDLLIKNKDEFTTVRVDYHDGLRYPRFERVAGTPARLDDILTARK
jgi:predicted metalloprotease with PDZ domain